MQDLLVAATPPIVTALLAAAGVWLRRRTQAHSGTRAVEESRSRVALITSMLDAYGDDPTRAAERERLMSELDQAYQQMQAGREAATRDRGGTGLTPLAREVLLLDRRPVKVLSVAVQALYYVSLAWVLLWLAAAVMFGLGIAVMESQDSFGMRLAMSLGITLLALAIGLAPAVVLHLLARMSAGVPTTSTGEARPATSPGKDG
jgi:hypothetical protein